MSAEIMTTQIGIIGAGPSGLLLARLLGLAGIQCVVLERSSRDSVLSRIRAGMLEAGTVETLRAAQLGDRFDQEGIVHEGIFIAAPKASVRVDFHKYTGSRMMVYGQTEIQKDLYAVHDAAGTTILHEVTNVQIQDYESHKAYVTFTHDGRECTLNCDFVAGCDGFHGVSRKTIADKSTAYERVYPFSWLGIISETPPVAHDVTYVKSERGFALCSYRSNTRSRLYLQVPSSTKPEDWSDDEFWAEMKRRLPADLAEKLVTGPSIEKSVAPLRSFVTEPMRWERLFLLGDAAHVVPPTGAKGLNNAVADVRELTAAFTKWYATGDTGGLDSYSDVALRRVWQAIRLSWWFTHVTHDLADEDPFQQKIKDAELYQLFHSEAAMKSFAQSYTGTEYEKMENCDFERTARMW